MATPAPAIADSRQLFHLTIADLNAERSQLITDIETARSRVSELEQQHARLQELIDASTRERNSLRPRLKQLEMSGPASDEPAPTTDSLRNKLKSEKDPRERFRIQERIDALSR